MTNTHTRIKELSGQVFTALEELHQLVQGVRDEADNQLADAAEKFFTDRDPSKHDYSQSSALLEAASAAKNLHHLLSDLINLPEVTEKLRRDVTSGQVGRDIYQVCQKAKLNGS